MDDGGPSDPRMAIAMVMSGSAALRVDQNATRASKSCTDSPPWGAGSVTAAIRRRLRVLRPAHRRARDPSSGRYRIRAERFDCGVDLQGFRRLPARRFGAGEPAIRLMEIAMQAGQVAPGRVVKRLVRRKSGVADGGGRCVAKQFQTSGHVSTASPRQRPSEAFASGSCRFQVQVISRGSSMSCSFMRRSQAREPPTGSIARPSTPI